jgi:hypothetical protein
MLGNEVGGMGDVGLFESSNRHQLSILSARVRRYVKAIRNLKLRIAGAPALSVPVLIFAPLSGRRPLTYTRRLPGDSVKFKRSHEGAISWPNLSRPS